MRRATREFQSQTMWRFLTYFFENSCSVIIPTMQTLLVLQKLTLFQKQFSFFFQIAYVQIRLLKNAWFLRHIIAVLL